MLTKAVYVGDEVLMTVKGHHNKIDIVGVRKISKIGTRYLYAPSYRREEQFSPNGTASTMTSNYELWDSQQAYEKSVEKRLERSQKVRKIQDIVSSGFFSKYLRDEVLDEILHLLTPQEKN